MLFVAAKIMGIATGKSKIGSITSRDLVLADMVEKMVPIPAKPNVPKNKTSSNGQNTFPISRSNKTTIIGSETS